MPRCTLAYEVDPSGLLAGVATVHPAAPVHARLAEAGITDTVTGETETLVEV